MPDSPSGLNIPVHLVVYDAIGTVLVGLGAARQFVGLDLIPERYLWPGYAVPFMVAGVAMMVPLLAHLLRRARATADRGN